MTTISISQLKTNPSAVITQSLDYPVAIENRNKVKAYLIGKDLYDKLITYIEDQEDALAVRNTSLVGAKSLEDVEKELGI
jgi:antitoxin StbD